MGEKKQLPRLNLLDVKRHSGLCERVQIWDGFSLEIRPWTPSQFDYIGPLLKRTLQLIKQVQQRRSEGEKEEELTPLDVILSVFDNENLMNYRDDILSIIYATIEKNNQTITVTRDGVEEEFALFTEEDMIAHLEMPEILQIVKIIYQQNFAKNRYSAFERKMPKAPGVVEEKDKAAMGKAIDEVRKQTEVLTSH